MPSRVARTFWLVLLALVLVIEICYQVAVRAGSHIPGFWRVYDYRYFDTEGTPRFAPKIEAWHRSYGDRPQIKIKINSQGFRGNEPLDKPSVRIVFIGDSTVFNGGVELEESFPFLLEKSLRDEARDPKIEILNLGIGDTGIRHYFLKLKHQALAYRPNLIVVSLYLNDTMDSLANTRRSPLPPHTPQWHYLFTVDYLSKTIQKLYLLLLAQFSDRFDWVAEFQSRRYLHDASAWSKMLHQARYDWGAAWQPESWKTIEQLVSSMQNLSAEHGVEIWFLITPASPQVEMPETSTQLLFPQSMASQMATNLKLHFLDPLPYLRSRIGKENLYYDQCHFSAAGNQAMADYLRPHLSAWLSEVGRNNTASLE